MRLGYVCRHCGDYHRGGEKCKAARRVQTAEAVKIRTDDNNPLKPFGEMLGRPCETRADIRRLEADGVIFTTPKDREIADSRRGKEPKERFREAWQRVHDRERVVI